MPTRRYQCDECEERYTAELMGLFKGWLGPMMKDIVHHLFSLQGLVVKDEGNATTHHLQPTSTVENWATLTHYGHWDRKGEQAKSHCGFKLQLLQISKHFFTCWSILQAEFMSRKYVTQTKSCSYICISHYSSLNLAIPTGGPAGTTHFFSGRVDGGVLLCFATPSCTIFSTFSSSSKGNGTWCTRKWDPSDGRGTFWNAMWGFGFSYRTHTACINRIQDTQ